MNRLRFGTAGKPISTKGDTVNGIGRVRELGLESMELEFVHSINLTEDKTQAIKETAKKQDIRLTCHAPFFINLNSAEKPKIYASIARIVNSAKITSLCGGWSVCFHAGFYQKQDPKKVYEKIREGMKEIVRQVKEFDKNIWIRPEISGKMSQFGDLNELIKLSQDIDQVLPCIDFSHLFARTVGKNNTLEEFNSILEEMEKLDTLNKMHIHVAGIEYGDKGEKHHLILEDSKFNYKDLMKSLKEFKVKGSVVCESPNIEEDAILMQNYYSKI